MSIPSEKTFNQFFGDAYQYQRQPDGQFLAIPLEDAEREPLAVLLPDKLPLDRKGNPFIPGFNCYDDKLHLDTDLLETIGLRAVWEILNTDVIPGNYIVPPEEGAKPLFAPMHPSVAEYVVLNVFCANKMNRARELITPDSDVGRQLQLVASWRIPVGNDDCFSDIYVFRKQGAPFDLQFICHQMETWIAKETAAGDVFAGTYRAVEPVYRVHMEDDLLPQLTAAIPDVDCQFNEHECVTSINGATLHAYPYTLEGAQDMAEYIACAKT